MPARPDELVRTGLPTGKGSHYEVGQTRLINEVGQAFNRFGPTLRDVVLMARFNILFLYTK
jgi:hypothetical protein